MFQKTEAKYIYYDINGVFYKIETFGKIVKIIDFGRATVNYNNKWYLSDVFSPDGDAEGQIEYPTSQFYNAENCKTPINFSFDLVRLGTTIHERLDEQRKIAKFVETWLVDDFNNNILDLDDDFSLYIHISKYCHNAKPSRLIKNKIFNQYTINKMPQNPQNNEKMFIF